MEKRSNQNVENIIKALQLKKIWDVHKSLKCPVIGACLTVDEHRKVLKKAGCQVKHLRPYNLHRMIMEHLDKENRISLKVENYFRYKYRNSIANFADMDEENFMKAWQEGFHSGHADSIFYVAVIKNNLSEDSLGEIFGDIHMQCHANMAEVMGARRDLELQREAGKKLATLLNQEKKRVQYLKQENSQIKGYLQEARLECEKLRKKQADTLSCEKTSANNAVNEKVMKLESRNLQVSEQICQLEREKRRLQIKMFELESANQSMAEEMKGLISHISDFLRCKEKCNEECSMFQICAKRILIVGGITKMKSMYRHLIESAGGEFEYHDGYMNNGKQNLEARVKKSDLIICPVNCNSHNACLNVKKFCRKHDKPVKMLPNSSLTAISNALLEDFGIKSSRISETL